MLLPGHFPCWVQLHACGAAWCTPEMATTPQPLAPPLLASSAKTSRRTPQQPMHRPCMARAGM